MTDYTYLNRPAAQALYQALTQDPFYIALENRADPDKAGEAMLRYHDYAMTEARDHGRLCLPPDRTSGAAIWAAPLDPALEKKLSKRKKDFIRDHLGTGSLEAYTTIVDFMATQAPDVVPDQAWYLSILGIAPQCQGNGLGRALMAEVLDETDRLGLATFAESFTPENFRFYAHLGFEPAKTVYEPYTCSSYTILVRCPGAGPKVMKP